MKADKKYPMRLAKFRDGWMDMSKDLPEPIVDRIADKMLDVPYGDDPLQKMDVYYPDEKKDRYPLFIVIHGGGWSHMDKRDWHLYPSFFALEKGFMVISVNYRLAPKNKLPDATHDCFNAFEHIINHADALRVDLKNVFVWGCSAGGNLGVATVLKYSKDERVTVRAMVAVVPALNVAPLYKTLYDSLADKAVAKETVASMGVPMPWWLLSALKGVIVNKMVKDTFGKKVDFTADSLAEYDAGYYLNDKAPKIYFLYGEKDPVISPASVEAFAEKMLEHGLTKDDIVLECLKDAPHMGATRHFFEEDVIMRYVNFCIKNLKTAL